MSYKDLQAEAKELGIKYIGVSKSNLINSIDEAKKKSSKKEKINKKVNIAVVRDLHKQEIRRYTDDTHGERFAELANEFAKERDYTVELTEAKKSVVCPNCGHVLN